MRESVRSGFYVDAPSSVVEGRRSDLFYVEGAPPRARCAPRLHRGARGERAGGVAKGTALRVCGRVGHVECVQLNRPTHIPVARTLNARPVKLGHAMRAKLFEETT